MKRTLLLILALALLLTGCATPTNINTATEPDSLTIYTYDSLSAEWGLLPRIIEQFETDNEVKLEVVSFADTGAMLNQLILEKNSPKADVVIGLDNVNYNDVVENELLTAYKPQKATEIDENLLFDESFTMTPFDYGYIGFIYDTEQADFAGPMSLKDLATDAYKDQIIIEQAGASSPGTQLILWAKAALNEQEYTDFWVGMEENVLTVTPDWSTAYYSMFLEGEAPIVLSYLTSPAYHIEMENINKYKAMAINEGYIRQVEGVGVVKNASNEKIAQEFIDYVLSDEVQNQIPTTQWMFPVLGDKTTWPAAYQEIIVPKADEILNVDQTELKNNYDSWLAEWNDTFGI